MPTKHSNLVFHRSACELLMQLFLLTSNTRETVILSSTLVPFSLHVTRLSFISFLLTYGVFLKDKTHATPHQISLQSSERIQIIQATDILILVNTLKQKHLEPLVANSLKSMFSFEHLHKYVLKSCGSVTFANILDLQNDQESICSPVIEPDL